MILIYCCAPNCFAADILGISDYLIMDSDTVWFKEIYFKTPHAGKYYYAYSSNKHPSYEATMYDILRIRYTPVSQISGIAHHMVMKESVLNAMKKEVLITHGRPMWLMMLLSSALELTCQAPGGFISYHNLAGELNQNHVNSHLLFFLIRRYLW